MRWLIAIAIAVAAAAAYLYFNPDEQRRILTDTPLAPEPAPTTVYKWRDGDGNWQVSDKPPAKGDYEVRQYRGDVNVMPSVEPPEAE